MRLQPKGGPDPADRRVRKAAAAAIERIDQCVASAGVERSVRSMTAATSSSSIVRGLPGALRPASLDAVLQKASPPLAGSMLVNAKLGGDGFAWSALCASKNDPAAFR